MANASDWVEVADKLCSALKKRVPCLAGTKNFTLFDLAKLGDGPCISTFEDKLTSLLCCQFDKSRSKAFTLAELEALYCSSIFAFVLQTLSRMPWQETRRVSGQRLARNAAALQAAKAARVWLCILHSMVTVCSATDQPEVFKVLSKRHARPKQAYTCFGLCM